MHAPVLERMEMKLISIFIVISTRAKHLIHQDIKLTYTLHKFLLLYNTSNTNNHYVCNHYVSEQIHNQLY